MHLLHALVVFNHLSKTYLLCFYIPLSIITPTRIHVVSQRPSGRVYSSQIILQGGCRDPGPSRPIIGQDAFFYYCRVYKQVLRATENERRRRTVNKISPKDKATIAKYVNEHGIAKVVRRFEDKSVGTENSRSLSVMAYTSLYTPLINKAKG